MADGIGESDDELVRGGALLGCGSGGSGGSGGGSGSCREAAESEEVIAELMKIRGVGEKLARELYERGIHSISALARAVAVPDDIRLLARYHHRMCEDVSIATARSFLATVEVMILSRAAAAATAAKQGSEKWQQLTLVHDVLLVGAHRRQHPSKHDIDALIVLSSPSALPLPEAEPKPEAEPEAERSERVTETLERMLSESKQYLGTLKRGAWRYSFLWSFDLPPAALKRPSRRAPAKDVTVVDIQLCPASQRGAALLHSTGPAEFNILLRKRAISMGCSLSEHGLFRLMPTPATPATPATLAEAKPAKQSEKAAEARRERSRAAKRLIHAATEEGIFSAMGLPFIDPADRGEEPAHLLITRTPLPPQ